MEEVIGLIVTTLAVLFIGAVIWAVSSYCEMNTFNKFSKTKATFWDAAFAELRVVPDK